MIIYCICVMQQGMYNDLVCVSVGKYVRIIVACVYLNIHLSSSDPSYELDRNFLT